MSSRKALVRRPSPRLSEGLVTHIDRSPVDFDLALRQWEAYVAVLRADGWETVEVAPADDCPDGVFVEDTMVVFRNVALIARPGADPRLGETAGAEAAVTALGLSVNRVREPGTLEGGDILKVGDTVYVGRGGRTNAEGVRQLRSAFEPLGATVVAVPVSKVLHLKSAVTALPDGTVIGFPPLVDDPAAFPASCRCRRRRGRMWCCSGAGGCSWPRAPRKARRFSGTLGTSRSLWTSASSRSWRGA